MFIYFSPTGTSTSTSEGTSTSNGDISPREIEIKFNETSSLSYADRLLLKKHRRTALPESASPNLMGKGGLAKDVKHQENVFKKENLVNGEANFTGKYFLMYFWLKAKYLMFT